MRDFMNCFGKKRFSLPLGVLLLVVAPIVVAFQSWERLPQPPAAGTFTAILTHPLDSGKLIVASAQEIFEGSDAQWKNLGRIAGPRWDIHQLLYVKEIPKTLFVLTSNGAYKLDLLRGKWVPAYLAKNPREKSALSFAVLPEDPDHWFIGTEGGLFESDDAGKTWFRFEKFRAKEAVPVLRFIGGRLFVATFKRLYVSEDLATFHSIFSLTAGDAEEFLEIEEAEDENDSLELPNPFSDFHELAGSDKVHHPLWLATEKGVFESFDGGKHWRSLSRSGLRSTEIKHLAYSEKSKKLFAGTPRGIYVYHFNEGRWEEIFQGLARPECFGLTIVTQNEKEILTAITGDGLMRFPIIVDGISASDPWTGSLEKMNLFRELIKLEPTARELHQAVIRYGNLSSGKIKRWHAESRLASFLPNLSFGKDFSKSNNVDIDRGSTTEADRFIFGPDDTDKGWDADVSWDLGDFVWSSNQTSIDSREKLMVELRNDMLAEATRIYYERRRLQMEIAFSQPANEQEHLERLIRMDELTALLDGMTDGFISKRLRLLYDRHLELNKLWEYNSSGSSLVASGSNES